MMVVATPSRSVEDLKSQCRDPEAIVLFDGNIHVFVSLRWKSTNCIVSVPVGVVENGPLCQFQHIGTFSHLLHYVELSRFRSQTEGWHSQSHLPVSGMDPPWLATVLTIVVPAQIPFFHCKSRGGSEIHESKSDELEFIEDGSLRPSLLQEDLAKVQNKLESLQRQLSAMKLMLATYEGQNNERGAGPVRSQVSILAVDVVKFEELCERIKRALVPNHRLKNNVRASQMKRDNVRSQVFSRMTSIPSSNQSSLEYSRHNSILVAATSQFAVEETFEQAIALFDFNPIEDNSSEMKLFKGETVIVVSVDDDMWWEGITEDGREGFFPRAYVQLLKDRVEDEVEKTIEGKVLYNYSARSEGELDIVLGQIVQILSTDNEEWWEVEYKGMKGYVPRNYLGLLNEEKNGEKNGEEKNGEEKNGEEKNGEKDDKTTPKASVTLPSSSTIRRESRALFDSINQSVSSDQVVSGRVRASTDSAKMVPKPLPSLPIKKIGEGPGFRSSSQGKGDVPDYSNKLFEALNKLESSTPQTLGEDIRRVRKEAEDMKSLYEAALKRAISSIT
ncbi:SH3 domain-containing protein 19-like [Planoprotostelium fungivorum]|uniref:SH3 domain-containing protein 19-like n=1 Tax=Planoprotostelium fungivorum TaxID=1890364 RepID=A0A2P6N515_9EUKA|nr:SH3 domain-containing protein 19-like [Planoprotostelium fungivorum]